MAYNSNIPQANDQLSTSQAQILGNFTSLGAAWPINHGAFDSANAGMHMFLQLPTVPNAQVAAVPMMAANQIGLVSQVSVYSGVPEMQVIRPNSTNVVEFTSAGAGATGWTRLPSGILLKWGSATITGVNTTATYPVAANIPVFAAVYQSFITPLGTGVYFVVPPSINGQSVNEIVVGYQGAFSASYRFSYLSIGI